MTTTQAIPLLTLALAVLSTSATAQQRSWPDGACDGLTAVSTVPMVQFNGYRPDDDKSLFEERIATSANIRLRTANISVSSDAPSTLFLVVTFQPVFETGYVRYDVAVELVEPVVVVRSGKRTPGLVGESSSGGIAGEARISKAVSEQLGRAVDDFINCVLAARDKAGEIGPDRTKAKKRAAPPANAK